MSAVDEIQAAIEKLIGLRDHSLYQGKWTAIDHANGFNYGAENADDGPVLWMEDIDARDLVVTLHNTIDAQLAILRNVITCAHLYNEAELAEAYAEDIDLARAINGVTP